MPAKVGCQIKADRQAEHRGERKRRHHHAQRLAAAPFGNDIADNGQHRRGEHAAKSAGHRAHRQQAGVGFGVGAKQRRDGKAAEQQRQCSLAVKAVDKKSREQPGKAAAHRINGYEKTELRRRDLEQAHELRPERHHQHEVQNQAELHRSKNGERKAVAPARQIVWCR
ncbi:MAG: hypothetical protein NT115_00350 [Proteobacteria bacterium]|nr:hypothetical protein [Pseudomonadota bacterium]